MVDAGARQGQPGDAARRWAAALEAWAIPPEILDAAPTSPYGFSPDVFARSADEALERDADTPSDRLAREALTAGGSVLDVGCGGGAASVRLGRRAGLVAGVDSAEGMLEVFAERMAGLGPAVRTVAGRWPDVAAAVSVCDVVVCHHVVYNVADIVPFCERLSDHARSRVVVETPLEHPVAWMAPYWRELHGIDRPEGPVLEDLLAVLGELGIDPLLERWERPFNPLGEDTTDAVAALRTRLCVEADRDDAIAALLERHPPPARRRVATLAWAGRPR